MDSMAAAAASDFHINYYGLGDDCCSHQHTAYVLAILMGIADAFMCLMLVSVLCLRCRLSDADLDAEQEQQQELEHQQQQQLRQQQPRHPPIILPVRRQQVTLSDPPSVQMAKALIVTSNPNQELKIGRDLRNDRVVIVINPGDMSAAKK